MRQDLELSLKFSLFEPMKQLLGLCPGNNAMFNLGSVKVSDVWVALGFSTLMLSPKLGALYSEPYSHFWLGKQTVGFLGWIVAVLIFASFNFLIIAAYRKWPQTRLTIKVGAFGFSIIALNAGRTSMGIPARTATLIIGFTSLVALILFLHSKGHSYTSILTTGCKFGAVYFPILVATGILHSLQPYHLPVINKTSAPDNKPPIIWIIFDELDQKWAFEQRPKNVLLPEFDRLRAQSVCFNQAHRPGPQTRESLPGLLIGQRVELTEPMSNSNVKLNLRSGDIVDWGTTGTIFTDMAKLGRHSGIVGFYHNYPGVLGKTVDHAVTVPITMNGVWAQAEFQLITLLPRNVALDFMDLAGDYLACNRQMTQDHKERVDKQQAFVTTALRDWKVGFYFFHIGLPHGPWLTEPSTLDQRGYFSNLVQTDKFLGFIRKELERQGKWDQTTLIVSSDHNFRHDVFGISSDKRVPLIVKMPNQKSAHIVNRNVKSLDTRALINQIATSGKFSDNDVAMFMTKETVLATR